MWVHIPKCLSSEEKGQTVTLANTSNKINSNTSYSLHCFCAEKQYVHTALDSFPGIPLAEDKARHFYSAGKGKICPVLES